MTRDLYQILGISPDADNNEVRSAHRALARKYHPDAGGSSSDERFREVQHAYDVLSDEESRAEYDRERNRHRSRIARMPYPSGPVFEHHGPRAVHVDLRHLPRRQPTERIESRGGVRSVASEADPWEELLTFLFGDLY